MGRADIARAIRRYFAGRGPAGETSPGESDPGWTRQPTETATAWELRAIDGYESSYWTAKHGQPRNSDASS